MTKKKKNLKTVWRWTNKLWDPKHKNNVNIKKKIQARTKEKSCFIIACIHGINEMEILIKAKR